MAKELADLVDRAYKEKPNPKDIRELRRKIEEIPELWTAVFHTTEVVRNNLINKIVSPEAARLALQKNVQALMDEMSYGKASAIEKLLIENVIITWLRLQWVEYQLIGFMGEGQSRMSVVEYWEKRLSVSQRRHLRACETLARVRKLLLGKPAVQVNIATQGGQQVNVAGDVVKK
jgi:hypothetical protein